MVIDKEILCINIEYSVGLSNNNGVGNATFADSLRGKYRTMQKCTEMIAPPPPGKF